MCATMVLSAFLGTSAWATEPIPPNQGVAGVVENEEPFVLNLKVNSNESYNMVQHYVPEFVSSFTVTAVNKGSQVVSVSLFDGDASVVLMEELQPGESLERVIESNAAGNYAISLCGTGDDSEGVDASATVTAQVS